MLRSKHVKWLIVYLRGYTACRLLWKVELKRGRNKKNIYICCRYIFLIAAPKRSHFCKGKWSVILGFFASSNYSLAIVNLQNECAKVKIELQEQNKCIKRLTLDLDKTTQFPRRKTEETRQKLINALSEIAAVESNANCAEVLFVCVCVIFFMSPFSWIILENLLGFCSLSRRLGLEMLVGMLTTLEFSETHVKLVT